MEITLNRNGWHKKLQEFVFRNPPHFNNFCPYFWLTIFCLIFTVFIPIVPFFKILGWIGRGIFNSLEKAGDWYERAICDPMWNNMALNMKEDDIIKSWTLDTRRNPYGLNGEEWNEFDFWSSQAFKGDLGSLRNRQRDAAIKKFDLWKAQTENWEAKLIEIKAKRKKFFEEQEIEKTRIREQIRKDESERYQREQARKVRRQKMFTAIVKYTKWLSYLLIGAAVALVCWGVYELALLIISFANYCIAHFHYGNFIQICKLLGWIVGGVLVAVGIVLLVKKLSCRIDFCICDSWIAWPFKKLWWLFSITIGRFCVWFVNGFVKGVIGIAGVFKFIGSYIMTIKENHCPGINWVEPGSKTE